jgi:sugar (pentulose or hexulose) kinase
LALFIGIDLGTSGCRAIAIDEHGDIQGKTSVPLPAPSRVGNCVEQNPDTWWNAVCTCLSVLNKQIDNGSVKAIAVDGTSASLLLVDKNGSPLHPALMYNDARAGDQAKIISEIAPPNTAAQGATCALAKLLWFYQVGLDNGIIKHVAYAMHQADWISARLSNLFKTGDFIYCDYNNALKMGFDAQQKTFPDWVVRLLDNENIPADILPTVVNPGTPIGHLSPELARQLNLPGTTRIIAGTTDSTASFIATGANQLGDAVTSLGSTLVLKVISDKPVFATEYGVYSQPLFNEDTEYWLVGGASNTGGAVLRQYFSTEQLKTMTPLLNPEKLTGLEYYPLPSTGERFPVNNDQLAPILEPCPEDDVTFFQGILEGIARIEAKGYRLLAELGAPYPVTVRTTGGGADNEAWSKIRNSMLSEYKDSKTEFIKTTITDAAYGSALLAQTGWHKRPGKKMASTKRQIRKNKS